ncbi:hypothetical protein LINPERPRIM_LOCUS35312 [Linum perenne]
MDHIYPSFQVYLGSISFIVFLENSFENFPSISIPVIRFRV